MIDRSDPDNQILEKIGQQFKDASEFLREDAGKARPQTSDNHSINVAK